MAATFFSDQTDGVRAYLDRLAPYSTSPPYQNGELHVALVLRVAALDKLIIQGRVRWLRPLIQELGRTLASSLRDRDVICVAGDRELALILPNLRNEAMLGLAANKIQKIVGAFEAWSTSGCKTTVHIGACFLNAVSSPDATFRNAYMAMLKAEKEGEVLAVFSEEHRAAANKELEIEKELHESAKNLGFELYYQPQLSLATHTLGSAEILIRWNHARLGFVPPNLFIPIAERLGLIGEITEWIVHKTLNFQSELRAIDPEFNLSINISPVNLKDTAFPQFVEEAVSLWGLPPELLTLELTEGAMLANPKEALGQLQRFKEIGVKLSVDDFGTGYSSLQYLSRLPVDEVKIDQSFIRDMQTSPRDKGIVNTVIDLARNFHLETVAEGVEDTDSLRYLAEIGCTKAQGYFISRPIPQTEFMTLIATKR